MKTVLNLGLIIITMFFLASCGSTTDKGQSIKLNGKYSKADVAFFQDFYAGMVQAAQNEDIDKSLAFYSSSFKGASPGYLDKLRANIQSLYVNYKNITYVPKNVSLTIEGDDAMASDEYTYTAQPEAGSRFKPLDYSGKERIYWKKENNSWRIVEWIYF